MRYRVLNYLFWESNSDSMGMHYKRAMDNRGWAPDWNERRRACEGRGPRNEDPFSESHRVFSYDPFALDAPAVPPPAGLSPSSPYRERKVPRF